MKMLEQVRLDHVRELAAFLEAVPPEDFDVSASWQTIAPVDAIRLGPITFRKPRGFAGCAMGWAAYSGKFSGLRLSRDGDLIYRGYSDFRAAEVFLGVTESMVDFLFDHANYALDHVDPGDVAARLQRFAGIVEARLSRRRSTPKPEPEVLEAQKRLRDRLVAESNAFGRFPRHP